MKGIMEILRDDEEIQQLRKQVREQTGEWVPFNYDTFAGIDHYKEYLRKCADAGEIVTDPIVEKGIHRFDGMFSK